MDAGHRAVIFDRFRGVQDIVVGEGTHFLIPWVQKPIIFDCRSRPRNVPVITGSKGESQGRLRGSVGYAADLGSGHDLAVREFEPRVGLWADRSEPGACFRFCVSLSL